MTYRLQIDLNPGDNQENDKEIELKADNRENAINEAKNIMMTGAYHPYGDDDDPNEERQIIGTVLNDDGEIAELTTTFLKNPTNTTVIRH